MIINLKQKLSWKWLIILILIVAIISGGIVYYKWSHQIVPEELFSETLNKTRSVSSYRYNLHFSLKVDGNTRVLSDIEGERAGKQFHIKGEMLKQNIELYQLEDKLLMKDSLSGRWMERPGTDFLDTEYFLVEIDPLESFNFEEIKNMQFLGKDKKKNSKFYIFTFQPQINNKILNKFWKDFTYKIWVNKSSHYINKTKIAASHKKNENDKMNLKIELYDFNKNIKIENPKKE